MSASFSIVAFSLTLIAASVSAGLDLTGSANIAVYWGQDSTNDGSQQSLTTYCANSEIDIIPMAFLYEFYGTGDEPVINFANSGNDCSTFSGTELLDCPSIGTDITTCQETYGKTILLSIGGATYTEGGFSSTDEAVTQANKIWAMFGPEQYGSTALRPFGSAILDGFDFDFESSVSNTAAFANQLRALMDADTSKSYYLTAAPQCPYPDSADQSMLDGAVYFDAIWVQFYNNYCGLTAFESTSDPGEFNFETWHTWATTVSANPNVRVLVGAPGSSTAAGSGYVSSSELTEINEYCRQFSSFGGIMFWDASQLYANSGYLDAIYAALHSTTSRIMKRSRSVSTW